MKASIVDSLAAKNNPRLAAIRQQSRLEGAIEAVCRVHGIALGPNEHAHLQTLDAVGLESLLRTLEIDRRWP